MAKKWTLENAVKRFTPHQIESLKRGRGNLNKRQFDSLIKEIRCYYEDVSFEGKGKQRIIYTDKKRKVKVKKEDNRRFNKGVAPPHSKYLALMIMSKLADIDNKARTRTSWATYFGVITPAEQDILKGIYSEKLIQPYIEIMIDLGIIENDEELIFQDLANILRNVVTGHLQTVFRQAEDLNLIRIISSWKGKVKNSKKQIDIDNDLANEINYTETELLKKHDIRKVYALMFKNSRKTKAFNAEWLEYIKNVEDTEGNVMQLQYIYEVFQIDVLKKEAFNEFIKVHYPSEIESFNIVQNEETYHIKLLEYIETIARKKQDNYFKKTENKKIQNEIAIMGLYSGMGLTEEEAKVLINQEDVRATNFEKESSQYLNLLESDRYIDCIGKIYILLQNMHENDCMELKKGQYIKDKQIEKEFERLSTLRSENINTRNNTISHHEDSINKQNGYSKNETQFETKKVAKQDEMISDNTDIEPSAYYDYEKEKMLVEYNNEVLVLNDEHYSALEEIRSQIGEDGGNAMANQLNDEAFEKLAKEFTEEEIKARIFNHDLQRKQEQKREREKWEKILAQGKPVKRKSTTNNPLDTFRRIRNGWNDKEDF